MKEDSINIPQHSDIAVGLADELVAMGYNAKPLASASAAMVVVKENLPLLQAPQIIFFITIENDEIRVNAPAFHAQRHKINKAFCISDPTSIPKLFDYIACLTDQKS